MKTQRDFDRCLGEKVEVRLFAPMRGKKYLEATLAGFDGKNVLLEGEEGNFPWSFPASPRYAGR